jgi:Uncharacterized ACR, COG1993
LSGEDLERLSPARDGGGTIKATFYGGRSVEEQAKLGGHPLHVELVRRLREAGAAGATVLRGV